MRAPDSFSEQWLRTEIKKQVKNWKYNKWPQRTKELFGFSSETQQVFRLPYLEFILIHAPDTLPARVIIYRNYTASN
jgi:hypothetical protein